MTERRAVPQSTSGDSNISRIVYAHRDSLVAHIRNGVDRVMTGLSDSALADDQYNKLASSVSDHGDFVEAQAEELVQRLEKEVEELIQWRIDHDPNIYTTDAVNELLAEAEGGES